jgi:hypothetical protein
MKRITFDTTRHFSPIEQRSTMGVDKAIVKVPGGVSRHWLSKKANVNGANRLCHPPVSLT